MLKPRTIARALIVEYVGQPSFSYFVDNSTILTDEELPNHPVRKTRRVLLPEGVIGYAHHVTFNNASVYRHTIDLDNIDLYSVFNLYHYYEVTFEGTVTLEVYMDEVKKDINNEVSTITLSTRGDKRQDTRKLYFPALSWGYIPHIKQTTVSTNAGQIHRAVPVALPARFYRGLRDHSEVQVTYQGFIKLDLFLDGRLLDSAEFDAEVNEEEFQTKKHYLPSGSKGYALQWIQKDITNFDGEIAVFESDVTLTDYQQPEQPVPT